MKNARGWGLVLGILLIVALGVTAMVMMVRGAVQSIPNLATQIAEPFNQTPTIIASPQTIIHSIQTLARLETIQYTIEKVISAETGQGPFGFLFGDKLLFVAHGTVIAGIDLEKLGEDDIWLIGGVLYVRLPEAEIFFVNLDNDKSYVYDRDTGWLTSGNVDLETEARKAAEDEILDAALEDGILDQARTNAENFILRLLWDLGFTDVVFVDN